MKTSSFQGSTVIIIFSLILLSITTLYNETVYQTDRAAETHHKTRAIRRASGLASCPRWYHVLDRKMKKRGRMKIGFIHGRNASLLGITCAGDVEAVDVHFERVSPDVEWKDLFPEWIDENQPLDSSACPVIPMPKAEDYPGLDAAVVDVSCPSAGRANSRDHEDVFRLQVNLVAANLLVAARGRKKNNGEAFAVFLGSCGPMMEIFRCDDLVFHEANIRVYKPDISRLIQKIHMPIGSCLLAPPFPKPGPFLLLAVTVLHSSEDYVCGAIALAQSIIMSNTTKDLILLADSSISVKHLRGNEWNYSKLRIWQLTEYQKLIFIDSDFIMLQNMDKFFVYPQLSAVANNRHIFNSGLMLVEPSSCMFRSLMRKTFHVRSYNGGDQGFLNEVFIWWHRWPSKLNLLKGFNPLPESMNEVISQDVYAMHYLGFKPWMCRQSDLDCNQDVPENKQFASDSAHKFWWQIYHTMPENLRSHCVLTPEMEERKKLHIAKPSK